MSAARWYFKELRSTGGEILRESLIPALSLTGLAFRLMPVVLFLALCYGAALLNPSSDLTTYGVAEATAICFVLFTVGFILGALYERLHVLMFTGKPSEPEPVFYIAPPNKIDGKPALFNPGDRVILLEEDPDTYSVGTVLRIVTNYWDSGHHYDVGLEASNHYLDLQPGDVYFGVSEIRLRPVYEDDQRLKNLGVQNDR